MKRPHSRMYPSIRQGWTFFLLSVFLERTDTIAPVENRFLMDWISIPKVFLSGASSEWQIISDRFWGAISLH